VPDLLKSEKTLRVIITGRVQGVCFRAWTFEEATRRNLSGWVRNRRDGAVEALFSGPPESVDEMLHVCRKGPPSARVDDIEPTLAPPPGRSEFHVLQSV
jgi:acylphosphatase